MEIYKTIRELDGVFFRMERNGKYENICFTDLSNKEMDKLLNDETRTFEWLNNLLNIENNTLRDIIQTAENFLKEDIESKDTIDAEIAHRDDMLKSAKEVLERSNSFYEKNKENESDTEYQKKTRKDVVFMAKQIGHTSYAIGAEFSMAKG